MTSSFVINRLPTLTRWVDTKWALAITTVAFALVSVFYFSYTYGRLD